MGEEESDNGPLGQLLLERTFGEDWMEVLSVYVSQLVVSKLVYFCCRSK